MIERRIEMHPIATYQIAQLSPNNELSVIGETYLEQSTTSNNVVSIDSQGNPVSSWYIYLVLTIVLIIIAFIAWALTRGSQHLNAIAKGK